jgi:hypothetical protein
MPNEKLFANRKEMFTTKDIDKKAGNWEGKIVVLKEKSLKEEYRKPQEQLWLARGGFGCDPEAMGRAVFATALIDGAEARWDCGAFMGVLKDEVVKELGICPKCLVKPLHEDEAMNSLSRDNETLICDECGTKESMEEIGL